MRLPSGAKRGNQSTSSPLVSCLMLPPSASDENRSWLPRRELDQTILALTALPIFSSAAFSSGVLSSPPPAGAPPVTVAQAARVEQNAVARRPARNVGRAVALSVM